MKACTVRPRRKATSKKDLGNFCESCSPSVFLMILVWGTPLDKKSGEYLTWDYVIYRFLLCVDKTSLHGSVAISQWATRDLVSLPEASNQVKSHRLRRR